MIYIEKNNTNKVVLTLDQSSQLTNPNYLFEFVYQGNLKPVDIYFTAPDESLAIGRYNLFTIDESSTGSTTGGNDIPISLMVGQYVYNVYEASASTLSVSATTGNIIQSGRMVVADINSAFINQIIPDQNNNNSNIYI